MNFKPMKILIIEDDVNDCNKFINCAKERDDVEICAVIDSNVEALYLIKSKHPEGIVLDLELNNSKSGNMDSLSFLEDLKKLKLNYEPVIIVTTHVNSKRTYEMLHKGGVDLILYKGHPNYSAEYVLNKFIAFRDISKKDEDFVNKTMESEIKSMEDKISEHINHEMDLIGVTTKLKGREYIHDAILYLIQNEKSDLNVIQYLVKIHKKSATTISNGIQNAIIHAWRVTSPDELLAHYKMTVNFETGIPTTMEFIYYYVDKIKKLI